MRRWSDCLVAAILILIAAASVSAAPADQFIPHISHAAATYQHAGYILGFTGLIWNLLGLTLLLRTRLSAAIRTRVYTVFRRPLPDPSTSPTLAVSVLYYLCFSACMLVWQLPVGLAGWELERHFGFGTESIFGFLKDHLIDYLISMMNIPMIWAGWRLYTRTPEKWWLVLWIILSPFILFQTALQPLLIAPLFNHFTPLPAGPLRNEIAALAQKADILHPLILIENTSKRSTHVNAYVTGWGPTTRIVIDDTAIKELPSNEILAMVGHEMGHYVEKHVWWETVSSVLGAGIMLWLLSFLLPYLEKRFAAVCNLRGLTDPASLPLVMLTLTILLQFQMPIANAESRYFEHRADAFGLRLTHLNKPMARLFVRFAERDYSDPDPPELIQWWYGSHPTLEERIHFALHYHPWRKSS